ncbi:MAG: type 4a pilus biogenesis protein PilO [Candidatus Omnitrophica bacterium]|nr:type 4a pilus biogenesis protein PilO [Candidatus Omnitrophota bacterium]
MRRLTPREKLIFGICTITGVIYFGYNFVYKPIENRKQLLNSTVTTQMRHLQKDLRLMQDNPSEDDQYAQLAEYYKQKNSNEQVMSAMIADIQAVTNQMSLKISDLKPQKDKTTGLFTQFSVSLTLDSSFSDMIKLLAALQNTPHNLDVDEVSFEKGSSRVNDLLRVRLSLSKPYLAKEEVK